MAQTQVTSACNVGPITCMLLLCCSLLWPASSSELTSPTPLHFLTSHSPPGEYLNEDGEVVGATVALIRLLMQRLDEPAAIDLLPWARAFLLAQQQPHTVLFETTRTEEREAMFQWVGPLKQYQVSLYGLQDALKQSDNRALVACEFRGSAHVDKIRSLGFREGHNLILTTKSGECVEMMARGRAHLSTFSDRAVESNERILHHQLKLDPYMYFGTVELYMAFSLDVEPDRVRRWQRALEQSYLDGSMRTIYQEVYPDYLIQRLEDWAQLHSPLAYDR